MPSFLIRRSRADWIAVITLLLVAIIFFSPAVTSGFVFGPFDIASVWPLTSGLYHGIHNVASADQAQEMGPWFYLDWQAVHHGQFPLWNRYGLLGVTQFLNFQSAPLSLPTLISYLFPAAMSYLVIAIIILFISGLGAYLFSRVIGLKPLPAMLAALTFEVCGSVSGWSVPLSAGNAYIGWILAASYLLLSTARHRRWYVTLLALSVAFSLYAGHPESCVIVLVTTSVVLVPFIAFKLSRHEFTLSKVGAFLVWETIGALLGILLAAPLLLPGQQIIAEGVKGPFTPYGFPITELIGVVVPSYYGTPVLPGIFFGQVNYYEAAVCAGTTAVMLAAYGVIRFYRSPMVISLCIGLVILILFIYDFRIGQFILQRIAVLSSVDLNRSVVGIDFDIAVLAGYGLQAMRSATNKRSVAILWLLGGVMCVGLFGLVVLTYHNPILTAAERSVRLHSLVLPILLCWVVPIAGVVAAYWRLRFQRIAFIAIILGQTAFLVSAGIGLNTYSPNFYPTDSSIQQVQHIVGSNLLGTVNPTSDSTFSPYGFLPDTNSAYNVRQFVAYDPVLPRMYLQSWSEVTGAPYMLPSDHVFDPSIDNVHVAQTYGISYVMGPPIGEMLTADSALRIHIAFQNTPFNTVGTDDAMLYLLSLYSKRPDVQAVYPWSRAGVIADILQWAVQWGSPSDPQLKANVALYGQMKLYLLQHPNINVLLSQALTTNAIAGFNVILSTPTYTLYFVPGASQFTVESKGSSSGRVTSAQWVNNYTIRVHVLAAQPSILIARLANVPGWHVSLNGKPAKTTGWMVAMQQVGVPAGSSTLTFTYWPPRLTTGISLAVLALIALIGWWLMAVGWRWVAAARATGQSPRGEQDDMTRADANASVIASAQLPAVVPLTDRNSDSSIAPRHDQELDEAFWTAMISGIAALFQVNFWVASRQLGTIVDAILTPLAQPYDRLPLSQIERDAFIRDMTGENSTSLNAELLTRAMDYLITQYQLTAETYSRFRNFHSGAHQSGGLAEQTYYDWMQSVRPHPYVPAKDVATWRRLSIVLPAYNEEEIIGETAALCLKAVRNFCPNSEIIIVDDGSRDQTGAIIDQLAQSNATVVAVHNRPNRGYGGALQAGFRAARGDLLFFMDSDGQFDINEIRELLVLESKAPGSAVVGYRAKRNDPFMRKLNAWGWKHVAHLAIGLRNIRDIDCAFKLLPTAAVRGCHIQAEGASINAEFLTKFQRMGVQIIQAPVTHHPRAKGNPTGANVRVIIRAFGELYRLRQQLSVWTPALGLSDTDSNVATQRLVEAVAPKHSGTVG